MCVFGQRKDSRKRGVNENGPTEPQGDPVQGAYERKGWCRSPREACGDGKEGRKGPGKKSKKRGRRVGKRRLGLVKKGKERSKKKMSLGG